MKRVSCIFLSFFFIVQNYAQTSVVYSTINDLRSNSGSVTYPSATLLGYYVAGDGGGGQFMWLTTLPSGETPDGDILISPSTGGGYWKRVINEGYYNVKWFGAKTIGFSQTPVTGDDNIGAFEKAAFFAARIYVPGEPNSFGSRVFIPGDKNYYYISRTWVVEGAIEISGEGGVSADQAFGTKIRIKTGQRGLRARVLHPNNIFSTPYLTLKNILLKSEDFATSQVNDTIHGIDIVGIINCYKVSVKGFTGSGFYIYGSTFAQPSDTSQYGNSSVSEFYSCSASDNKINGFSIIGADAQVCTFIGCDSRNNGKWGFYEKSDYGNTYLTCVTHGNGVNVPAGQGGGFTTDNTGINSSVYLNCYSETDQNDNTSINNYSLRIGHMGQGWNNTAPNITGEGGWVNIKPGFKIATGDPNWFEIIGYNQRNGNSTGLGLYAPNDGSTSATTYDTTHKFYVNRLNNTNDSWSYIIAGNKFKPQIFGRTDSVYTKGRIVFPKGFSLRDLSNSSGVTGLNFRTISMAGRLPQEGDSPELYGEYAKGDIIINSNGDQSGVFGWRCIVSGKPGEWEEIRTSSAVSATAATSGNTIVINRIKLADNTIASFDIKMFGKGSGNEALIDKKSVKVKRISGASSIINNDITDEFSDISGSHLWWVEVEAGTGDFLIKVYSASSVNWKSIVEKNLASF